MDLAGNEVIDGIRAHLQGAPDFLTTRHLRRAARRVARETLAWKAEVYRAQSVEDERSVAVDPTGAPANLRNSRVWMLDGAWTEIEGQDDPEPVEMEWDGVNATVAAGSRKVAGVLVVRAVLEPDDTATVLPDNPFDLYRDAIFAWTLREMCVIPGTHWYKPSARADHERDYRTWIADAAVRTARRGTTGRIRTGTREFI